MKITVNVTNQDINDANRARFVLSFCFICPVYRALKRLIGWDGWVVKATGLSYGGYFIPFENQVVSAIQNWDKTGKMEPFSFTLSLPKG